MQIETIQGVLKKSIFELRFAKRQFRKFVVFDTHTLGETSDNVLAPPERTVKKTFAMRATGINPMSLRKG